MVDVLTIGFSSEKNTDEFLDLASLNEYGLRAVGNRIYLDIFTCDEEKLFGSISEFILKTHEKSSVGHYIDRAYNFFTEAEKQMIVDAVISEKFIENVKPRLTDVVSSCIKESRMLDVEGFSNFRLKWLKEVLCRRTDVIAEDIIAKREYDELVGMLKYILANSVRNSGIILDFSPTDCKITDLEGLEIDCSSRGHNIAEKDYFIGLLAKMSPEKIIIRNKEYCDDTLMMVISDVFGKSVIVE